VLNSTHDFVFISFQNTITHDFVVPYDNRPPYRIAIESQLCKLSQCFKTIFCFIMYI